MLFATTLSARSGQYRRELESIISEIVTLLAADEVLPEKNRDHNLGAIGEITVNVL